MELEELKKSWNALDEHLKDKELIKEDELERLIGHADKGIHAIARPVSYTHLDVYKRQVKGSSGTYKRPCIVHHAQAFF